MINLKTHRANTNDLEVGQRFIDKDFVYIYEVTGIESIGCTAKVVGSTHDLLFASEVVNVIEDDKRVIISEYKGRTLKTGFFDDLWHCWSSDGYLFNHSQGPEEVTEIMKQWIDNLENKE